jgi:hypothetical protein
MPETQITARERWLTDAIAATSSFIEVERAENAYDLVHAAPGSSDYAIASDSEACLELAGQTLAAMEAERAEIARRRTLRQAR